MAAVLAGGDGTVLSHAGAAALWGLRTSNAARVDVTVPGRGGRARRAGIVFHRSPLAGSDVRVLDGIPVTSPERTLLDLAEVVPKRALERALDEAEVQRLVDWSQLAALVERSAGRFGAARVRAVLADHVAASTLTRSELEERFLALCDEHGLPTPVTNVHVAGHEVDFAWPSRGLVVEVDGHRFHGTRAAFERDRARDLDLTVAGYRVVRLTHRRLARDAGALARTLRRLLVS